MANGNNEDAPTQIDEDAGFNPGLISSLGYQRKGTQPAGNPDYNPDYATMAQMAAQSVGLQPQRRRSLVETGAAQALKALYQRQDPSQANFGATSGGGASPFPSPYAAADLAKAQPNPYRGQPGQSPYASPYAAGAGGGAPSGGVPFDPSQPSSISYNVHGAPMGGPGGQDRGGWTNVPLDDNRQPIGTPQSRQQPAYTDLAGKRLTPGTQTPATPMAEPSPQSSQAALAGRAAGSGTDPNDPFAPQKPPQMPPPITPAMIEAKIKELFPNLPPNLHAQMMAQAMAGHGPIGGYIKQYQADLWKRYGVDSKTYNTYLKGSQQEIAKAAAKDASDMKAANSTATRLDKRQSEIAKDLAGLKTDPTDADAFAAKSDTDKGIAGQVKTLMDEWKDNQRQLDEAHGTLKRIVTMHQNVAKAKQSQQQWTRHGAKQRPSTPEERQGTPTGPAPAQAPGPNQPHSFWNPFGASPEAAQPGVQGPAQQVGGQPQQPPGQPQPGPAQAQAAPAPQQAGQQPVAAPGQEGAQQQQQQQPPGQTPQAPGGATPGQGPIPLPDVGDGHKRAWIDDTHLILDGRMVTANPGTDFSYWKSAMQGGAGRQTTPGATPGGGTPVVGQAGATPGATPAPTDRPSGGAFPNVAAQAGRVAQDFAGQAGGQATPEDEAQVKAAIAERQKAGTYGSLNIGAGAATKAMKHAIDAINQGVPRWFVMQMLKVMDFEKGVAAATPSAKEMGQRLRQPMEGP